MCSQLATTGLNRSCFECSSSTKIGSNVVSMCRLYAAISLSLSHTHTHTHTFLLILSLTRTQLSQLHNLVFTKHRNSQHLIFGELKETHTLQFKFYNRKICGLVISIRKQFSNRKKEERERSTFSLM